MLTRKEFLKKGATSLGRTLLQVSGALRPSSQVVAATAEPALSLQPGERLVAAAFNQHCLARSCGCFTCLERCEAAAIELVPGEGIRIDSALCTGCGSCETLCPVAPKAIRLQRCADGAAAG